MLILDRKVNQSIQIGNDVTIVVYWVDGDSCTVSLGICAPNSVKITRSELLARAGNDTQSLSNCGAVNRDP